MRGAQRLSGLRKEGYLKSVAGAGREEYAFSRLSFRESSLSMTAFFEFMLKNKTPASIEFLRSPFLRFLLDSTGVMASNSGFYGSSTGVCYIGQ
jgi:hypothetical protein